MTDLKAVREVLDNLPDKASGKTEKPILLNLTRAELEVHRTALAAYENRLADNAQAQDASYYQRWAIFFPIIYLTPI